MPIVTVVGSQMELELDIAKTITPSPLAVRVVELVPPPVDPK